MKRKRALVSLGETEMEVLHAVWALGSPTVSDVHARLTEARPLAYTTVLTVLRNLTEKGYLSATRDGVRDRYTAAQDPETVRVGLLQTFLGNAFQGSPFALVHTLVRAEKLSEQERAEIRRLLDEI